MKAFALGSPTMCLGPIFLIFERGKQIAVLGSVLYYGLYSAAAKGRILTERIQLQPVLPTLCFVLFWVEIE